MNRHRVLMTADAVGGVWPYALTLAETLGDRAEVTLAVMGPAPSIGQRAAAARIPRLRLVHEPLRLEWMLGAGPDLARAAEWLRAVAAEFDADLLHLNGYALAGERWAMPVLVIAHSCVLSWWQAAHGEAAPPEWTSYAKRVAEGVANADWVVAPSRTMLNALRSHYGRPESGQVIYNGIHLDRFIPGVKEEVVLAAGRLWDEAKNLVTLDAAASRLSWPVLVAGDCRHPDGRIAAPQAVRALGLLAPEDLTAEMARAAVFAAPARYEPFGLSVLEAAASGCALVLSDIPSFRELWHGAALFVPPDDAAALADAIAALMADAGRRQALADVARQRSRRYAAEHMAAAYAALYDEMTRAARDRAVPITAVA